MRSMWALVLLCSLASAPATGRDRDERVLAWDDGGPLHAMAFIPVEGRQVAVMFQAPEGFTWLRRIRCYILNDNAVNPDDPTLPTTGPFIATVWRPSEEGGYVVPASPPHYEFDSGELYPEDMWDDFVPPEPVDLSDPAAFPGRVFFIGMQWLSIYDPVLSFDWDPLAVGNTWYRFPTTEWTQSTESTAMIRAVVSDESGTPVEIGSWGRIKAEYE
jgi:hypothetical protein